MSCPSPFSFFYLLYDIFDIGFLFISDFLTLSRNVIFSIRLSMACCAVLSFCSRYFVVVQVSQPYVIVGNTHWLKTLFLNINGSFLSHKMSLYLPKHSSQL